MTAAEDRQRQRAVDALVRRLRDRRAAVAAGADDVPDDEPFAVEYITALWGWGWRPTEAKPSPHWSSYGNGSAPTETFKEALKALHARAGGQLVQGEVIPDCPAIEARDGPEARGP